MIRGVFFLFEFAKWHAMRAIACHCVPLRGFNKVKCHWRAMKKKWRAIGVP